MTFLTSDVIQELQQEWNEANPHAMHSHIEEILHLFRISECD